MKSETLLPSTNPSTTGATPRSHWTSVRIIALLTVSLVALHVFPPAAMLNVGSVLRETQSTHASIEPICPQQHPLSPKIHRDLAEGLDDIYQSAEFKLKAVHWLSGAIQIPTESYDHMSDVGFDKRWEIFGRFHDYLYTAFPLIHETLELTKVNTYGLVYRWPGSDSSLKPLLLLAHQDVVPVNNGTVSEWIYPPYSGHFDGEYVWGRGARDDKSGLISSFIALESLVKQGFKPRRSIFLASGFDEEAGGTFGAQSIANYLLSTFGENYFAMLVDEGNTHKESFGAHLFAPGVGEKGSIDVRLEVTSPGGHSSIPPPHTSIGLLALALVHIEENPHLPHLTRTSPIYSTWLCQAEHAPQIPWALKEALKLSIHSDISLRLAEDLLFRREDAGLDKALLGTTQAIDLIEGGIKVNALPEQASAVINHRVSTDSSIADVFEHLTDLLAPLALRLQLSFEAFGKNISSAPGGTLRLSDAWGKGLEPAPITPTDAAPFKLLSGTILKTWETGNGKGSNETVVVAPGMMSGNTDTRYFWKLTSHIFRYSHLDQEDGLGLHTVNEALSIKGFLDEIRFFTYLILNADEAQL